MKKKFMIVLLLLVLLYSAGGVTYFYLNKTSKPVIKNISSIKNYPYKLKSNATSVMKNEFNILKDNLESKNINEESYASSIAKLFIIDLYTITNKINKYDIETEYIYPDAIDNYKLNVTNTLYKYVESNEKGKRTQKLPEVTKVTIEKQEPIEFEINKEKFNGYKINVVINYIEDLGYDSTSEIIVIKKCNIYYIAEKK
ncbi:MAG: hypothetical protein PHR25_05485 [Clostridia bacterium]|nr:hypothetical protein [Clostridia bacterium]